MSPLRGVAKGNAFARLVAAFVGTECRTLSGAKDRGDLVHRLWTCEVKAPGRGKPLNLSAAMNEAKIEAGHAGTPGRYCVVTRRTGYPVAEAFFTIPLWMAVEVVPGVDMGRAEGSGGGGDLPSAREEVTRGVTIEGDVQPSGAPPPPDTLPLAAP